MHAWRAAHAFDGERFLEGGVTVLVDGARIAGVEAGDHVLPHDCPVTSWDGTLLPGLVDAHVHLVGDGTPGGLERAGQDDDATLDRTIRASLARHAAAGVTTVRDLGDAHYRTLAHRDRHGPGEPRIVAAGPPVTVPGGHCHFLGGAASGVAGVRAAVSAHTERGVDVIKVMASGGMVTTGTDVLGAQFSPEELHALVEECHGAGLAVLAHAHSLAGVRHAVAAGVDGLEHGTCLTATGIAVPDDELLDALVAGGVTVDPTLSVDPAHVLPLDELPPNMRAVVERLGIEPGRLSHARAPQLRAMHRRGVRLVTGTDAGAAPPKRHGGAWRAVVDLLLADLPVAEALATATSYAADACGLRDETGRLRAGLAADLLVVDGDLVAEPEALGRPVAVLVRGEPPVVP
ncbi:amidohydrolase family protein [Nocardioides taihuensis]|uniref:Amidohydrolase family protein n=1 Tax=Nocardioides taihuensis TaxID=1835606 RepID=A0ABW0BPE3_9ACTN